MPIFLKPIDVKKTLFLYKHTQRAKKTTTQNFIRYLNGWESMWMYLKWPILTFSSGIFTGRLDFRGKNPIVAKKPNKKKLCKNTHFFKKKKRKTLNEPSNLVKMSRNLVLSAESLYRFFFISCQLTLWIKKKFKLQF